MVSVPYCFNLLNLCQNRECLERVRCPTLGDEDTHHRQKGYDETQTSYRRARSALGGSVLLSWSETHSMHLCHPRFEQRCFGRRLYYAIHKSLDLGIHLNRRQKCRWWLYCTYFMVWPETKIIEATRVCKYCGKHKIWYMDVNSEANVRQTHYSHSDTIILFSMRSFARPQSRTAYSMSVIRVHKHHSLSDAA